MSGFHKPTVVTVAILVVVLLVAFHFIGKRNRSAKAAS